MKYFILLFTFLASFFGAGNINAQEFRLSFYGQQAIVLGDFAQSGLSDPSAGYAQYGSISGFEFQYYPNQKFGIGMRSSFGFYDRSRNNVESDLVDALGLADDFYDLEGGNVFFTAGSDLGVSYQFKFSEMISLEPYFYLGFRVMRSPQTWLVYSDNGSTFNYRTKSDFFFATSIAPGARVHFHVSPQFGINLNLEYSSAPYSEEMERTILTSENTFVISDFNRTYTVNSFNVGLGVWYRFGPSIQ